MGASREELVIIGAGIQGLTVALALAERGVKSTVLEQRPRPLEAASLRNEGKIHLGFVYALDASGRTMKAMVEGALTFAPLIERWCGPIDWRTVRSGAYAYVVMEDSLASPDRLEHHYRLVMDEIERAAPTLGRDYLGDESIPDVVRGEGNPPGMVPEAAEAWFETPERSVDPRLIRRSVLAAVTREPLIEVRTSTAVTGVDRTPNGFSLDTAGPRAGRIEAGQVVNCSWESRLRLDRMALGSARTANFRVKHHVVVSGRAMSGLSPVTMVQGPYGDLVPRSGGEVYLSWYPVGRTWFGDGPAPDMEPDPAVAEMTLAAMSDLFPGLLGSEVADHGPCHIVALTEPGNDIDDLASGLHSRLPEGLSGTGGWWSLSGGKLTTAPLASERCAALITGEGSEF